MEPLAPPPAPPGPRVAPAPPHGLRPLLQRFTAEQSLLSALTAVSTDGHHLGAVTDAAGGAKGRDGHAGAAASAPSAAPALALVAETHREAPEVAEVRALAALQGATNRASGMRTLPNGDELIGPYAGVLGWPAQCGAGDNRCWPEADRVNLQARRSKTLAPPRALHVSTLPVAKPSPPRFSLQGVLEGYDHAGNYEWLDADEGLCPCSCPCSCPCASPPKSRSRPVMRVRRRSGVMRVSPRMERAAPLLWLGATSS